MYWTYVQILTFLSILAVIFGGGYVAYRNATTPETMDLYAAADLDLSRFPPTVCRTSWSSFEAAGSAVAYIVEGKFRMDVQMVAGKDTAVYHIVKLPGKAIEASGKRNNVENIDPADIVLPEAELRTVAQCDPWWFPNRSFFNVL
ncbi:MAG: hypothetical protein AAB804_02295 [Patescibacteria group bacterium]